MGKKVAFGWNRLNTRVCWSLLAGMGCSLLSSLLFVALIELIMGCAIAERADADRNSYAKSGDPTVCIFATCVRNQLDKAIAKSNVNVPEEQRSLAVRRAVRLEEMLKGVRILWVDDNPENNNVERNLLGSLGMSVDLARTTELAMTNLRQGSYDLVISDMKRSGDDKAGLRLLSEIHSLVKPASVIFYAAGFDPRLGVPPYAFGMTNRPDELLNLVLDVIERLRSELLYECCNGIG